MNYLLRAICLIAALGAATAYAHHSQQAAYTSNVNNFEGIVTEFNFTNPHVHIYLDVTDENGETSRWAASGLAANLLRRQGWTADTIQPGQYLRVTGREARNGSPMVLMSDVIEIDPATGSLVRVVQGESNYDELAGISALPLSLADGRPNLTGAWISGPRGGRSAREEPKFNQRGKQLQANFDPVSDPALNCEPPGLVRQAGFTAHPVRVTQNDDHVVLEYEAFGGRRVVYFEGKTPDDDEHTRMGSSIARYEGDTLVIESTHLLANYTGINGNPLSDQSTTIESYRRVDDPEIGAGLVLDMVVTDPVNLTAQWTLTWKKYYTQEYTFVNQGCRVPSTYVAPEYPL